MIRLRRPIFNRPRPGTGGPNLPPPWDPRLPQRLLVAVPLTTVGLVGAVLVVLSGALSPSRTGGAAAQTESGETAPDELVLDMVPSEEAVASGAAAAGAPAGATATDAAAPAPGTSVPAAPASPTLAVGPATPARLGTYQFRVTMDGQDVAGTYTVSAGGSADSQVHRTEVDGSSSEQQLSFGAGGISLNAIVDANLGECRWSPPAVVAPGDLDVGRSWSSASDCTSSSNGVAVSIHQESDATVESRGHTMVGDELVEVWVVQRHEVQTRQANGATATSEVVASELLAPQLGIVIERQTQANVPFPDGSVQSVTVTERIEDLP
jgi:hypothetical protein